MDSLAKTWRETTVVYRVLARHLETFLARTDDAARARSLLQP